MRLTPEEQTELKDKTLEIAGLIHQELKNKIASDQEGLKTLGIRDLLRQFTEYINILKVQDPKFNIAIPLSFDSDKARAVKSIAVKKLTVRDEWKKL